MQQSEQERCEALPKQALAVQARIPLLCPPRSMKQSSTTATLRLTTSGASTWPKLYANYPGEGPAAAGASGAASAAASPPSSPAAAAVVFAIAAIFLAAARRPSTRNLLRSRAGRPSGASSRSSMPSSRNSKSLHREGVGDGRPGFSCWLAQAPKEASQVLVRSGMQNSRKAQVGCPT